MKVKWNSCFLCLNDLAVGQGDNDDKTALKKRRNARKSVRTECNKPNRASAALLLNYLLHTNCKKYSGVIDNILELIKDEENKGEISSFCYGDATSVKFCDKCQAHLKTVHELHEKLEVVQMKLVHVLNSVQGTVVRNSKKSNINGNGERNENDSQAVGLDIFEDWLKEQEKEPLEDGESQLKKQRKILDTFYSFQEAVLENARNSLVIPMIFLEKFTKFKPHLTLDSSEINIKTEPVDENLNNVPSPEAPDWFSEILDDEPPEPPKKLISTGRKRKKKNKIASFVDVKVKNENDDDEEFVPRKKVRSASSIARLRISATQKIKPKPVKIKKEETEPPRKLRGEALQPFRLMPHSRKPKEGKKYKASNHWACATCPFVSNNKYSFEHHLRTHEVVVSENTTTPLFHCKKCENLTFSVQQNYQFHMACHEGAIIMPCDICNVACKPFSLLEHMKTHLETVPKLYPCPNCSYCCSTREKYLQHLKFHIKNGTKLECDVCRETCPSRSLLLAHYHKEHQLLEKLTCDEGGCTKEFLDPDDLKWHKAYFHATSNVCQQCGKVFSSAKYLEVHLALHAGEKPFVCKDCSETFSCKKSLKLHMANQHKVPKVKCEYCEMEYVEKPDLKRHIARFHTLEFVCDYPGCGKACGTKNTLLRHKVSHTDEKKFSCEVCGVRFKLAYGLKKHMAIHFGEKKFKCQYCEKAFLRVDYLTQHERIHTNEKGYICEKCGAGFNQQSVLHRHKLSCLK